MVFSPFLETSIFGSLFQKIEGRNFNSPVEGAAAAATLTAKWAELNQSDMAIPLNTCCSGNMNQILRVCDITLPQHHTSKYKYQ